MADVQVPRNHDYRLGAVNEFSEVNRWGSEVDARLVEIIACLGASVKRVNILTTKSTPGSIGAHAPQHYPQTGFDPLLTAAPTGLYGATAAVGTSDNLLRADARFRWPNALTEYSFNSTVTLTSDGTSQTLTGSLGDLHIRTASHGTTLDWWTSAGGLTSAFPGTILLFSATTLNTSTALTTGISGFVNILTGNHVGTTFRAMNMQCTAQAGATFTSASVRGCDVLVGSTGSLVGTNSFTDRVGYRCVVNPALQSGAGPTTVADTYGFLLGTWSTIGNAATHTNVAGARFGFPTMGVTIRRGVWVSSQTTNLGTEPASVEGFYCEAMTRANDRYNYYGAGATTGTPTTVTGYYQAGHTVGTTRIGFRAAGANTGTPTDVYGFLSDSHTVGDPRYGFLASGATSGTPTSVYGFFAGAHSVGTFRWGVFSSNKVECATSDFITTTTAKGLVTVDTQGSPHFWRITADSTGATTESATLAVDANQILTVTRGASSTGTVNLKVVDTGTTAPTS